MKMNYEGIDYDCCDEYSFGIFNGWDLSEHDLNGRTIYGSSFFRETPDSQVFAEDLKGVTFIKCLLDNVFIPLGNTVIGGSQRRFQVQTDGDDWLVDEDNNPVRIANDLLYIKKGLELPKPEDLPERYIAEQYMTREEYEKQFSDGVSVNSSFREIPKIISENDSILTVRGWAWLQQGKI